MSEGTLEDFGLEVDVIESPRCDVCQDATAHGWQLFVHDRGDHHE